MTELRKLSCDCELEDLRESLLRDILLTVFDEKIFQELLLRESNHLHLNKMVDISRTVEIIRSQTHAIQIIRAINLDCNVGETCIQFSTKKILNYLRNVNFVCCSLFAYYNCKTSINKALIQIMRRFKTCDRQ